MKDLDSIYSLVEIPEWVNDPATPEKITPKVDSPYFFPVVNYQLNIENTKNSTFTYTYECINDESRIEDSSLILHELQKDYEHLLIHSICIIRNGKIINALLEENISTIQRERSLESHIVDNKLTVSITIDDLRLGDHIEYKCTRIESSGEHPLLGKHLFSHYRNSWGCPVDYQSISVLNQSELPIVFSKVKLENGRENIEKREVSPNDSVFLEWKDLLVSRIPNSTPNWVWGDYTEIATKTSWEEVSKHLYQYFTVTGALEEPTFDFTDEPMSLVLSSDDKETQILSAIRFVQNKIRYRGEHHGVFTHTPKTANIILKKRAGDCKDKSNLLVQMLSYLDINAFHVLVHTRHGEKIDNFLPSAYQFNHMIVGFEWQNKTYFVDPTIQKQSGTLESMAKLEYGWGLPLSSEGSSLVYIERDITQLVFSLLHEFEFHKKSDIHRLTIKRKFFSHRADNMRAYFDSKEKSSYQSDFLNSAKSDTGLNLEIIQPIVIAHDNELENQLETIEQYQIIDIHKSHDNKPFYVLTEFTNNLPLSEHKMFPVSIHIEGKLEHKIIVHYDRVPDLEESQSSVNSDGFLYKDEVSKKDDKTIVYFSEITPKKKWIEGGAEATDHYDNVLKVDKRSNNSIYHKNGNIFNFDYYNIMAWLVILIGIIGILWD